MPSGTCAFYLTTLRGANFKQNNVIPLAHGLLVNSTWPLHLNSDELEKYNDGIIRFAVGATLFEIENRLSCDSMVTIFFLSRQIFWVSLIFYNCCFCELKFNSSGFTRTRFSERASQPHVLYAQQESDTVRRKYKTAFSKLQFVESI